MRYEEFKNRIDQMAAPATPAARCRFAVETIRLLRLRVEKEIQKELTEEERKSLSALLTGFETESPDQLAQTLNALVESITRDDVRAIEFHPTITELLCAFDNWINYRRSPNPKWIANMAIDLVNVVDYEIGGNAESYSVRNILGAPEMVAELERQKRILSP